MRAITKRVGIAVALLLSVLALAQNYRDLTPLKKLVSNTTFSNDHSMVFDGSTTYVNIGDVAPFHALDYNTANCLSYWVKATSTGSSAILDKQPSLGYIWQWSANSAGNPLFQLYDGTNNYQKATVSSFNDGAWHNVVQSWDGSCTGTMFVDGTSQTLQTFGSACPTTTVVNTAAATIGAYHTHALLFFGGKLTQIAFWSGISCNATRASTIYNSGHPGDLTSLSPSAWYQFSTTLSPADSASGIIHDRGSAGANGTVGGTGSFSTDVP